MIATIYKIEHVETGKLYIGVTICSLGRRWAQHKSAALRGTSSRAIHRAMAKHGLAAFRLSVIEQLDDLDAALLRERALIAQLGTIAPCGYNLTTGGEMRPGFTFSDETKAKLRAIFTGRIISAEVRAKIAAAGRGRIYTAERNRKVSEAFKRRTFSPETIAKMRDAAIARIREPVSEATRAKLRARGTAAMQTPEVIAKRVAALTGYKHTDEARANMSRAGKGKPKSAEHNAKVSAAKKGWIVSETVRAAMSEGQKRRWARERTKTGVKL